MVAYSKRIKGLPFSVICSFPLRRPGGLHPRLAADLAFYGNWENLGEMLREVM
jgi:hypothetical protein